MPRRRRLRQTTSLQARLEAWSTALRERAENLPPGPEREELLRKLSQAHAAAHIDDWAHSPETEAPASRPLHSRT